LLRNEPGQKLIGAGDRERHRINAREPCQALIKFAFRYQVVADKLLEDLDDRPKPAGLMDPLNEPPAPDLPPVLLSKPIDTYRSGFVAIDRVLRMPRRGARRPGSSFWRWPSSAIAHHAALAPLMRSIT
jgi:hypothetical protein